MNDNRYMFKFEFSSCHNKIKNMNYDVYAESEEDMKMFLTQHNFTDAPLDSITVIPKEECDNINDAHILKTFLFKSNRTNEIYHVITCDWFVDFAVETTCNELRDSLIFGEAIIRRDIEIFKLIGDLVSSLPHVNIMDFALADIQSSTDNILIDHFIEMNNMKKEYSCKCLDDLDSTDSAIYYVHESMEYSRCDDQVQPITLEAYVSAFTETMFDAFN